MKYTSVFINICMFNYPKGIIDMKLIKFSVVHNYHEGKEAVAEKESNEWWILGMTTFTAKCKAESLKYSGIKKAALLHQSGL